MLQIYVYGPVENGFLELDDVVLEMEQLQPQFDEDLTTGEFSIPFDIKWTDNNRRLLGYAERVKNFNYGANYYMCDVYDDGVPEMQQAKLTLLGKSGRWTYDRGIWNASVSGTKGLFGAAIKNKSLKDIDYGPIISWTSMDSRNFAKDVVGRNYADDINYESPYHFLRFAPVAIENFIDKDRGDYTNEFLTKDTVNNVVFNTTTYEWWFGSPKPDNPSQPTTPADEAYLYHRTVPFMCTQYILKKIFEHYGYSVTGDWVDDVAFKNLTQFNNYAIENYNVTSRQDNNRSINLRNHVPERMISVFLKSLFGFFGLYMVFEDNNTVRLVYYKAMLRNKKIAKLDEFIINQFDASYEDGQSAQGYKLDYAWDDTEGYHSDRIKDPAASQVIATVARREDPINIGRQLTTDDVIYVSRENLYYKVANATTNPIRWDCWAEKLGGYTEGDGEESFDFGINPLPVYAYSNEATGVIERADYVGTRLKGSYLNNKGVRVSNPYGLFIFYAAVVPIAPPLYLPASFTGPWYKATDNDPLEIKGAVYSLAWNGVNGMAFNFHADWKNVTRNKETLKVILLASKRLEYVLKTNNHFEIGGVLFLLKQINKRIPMGTTMEALMVAADTESVIGSAGGKDSVEGSAGVGEDDFCHVKIKNLVIKRYAQGNLIVPAWELESGYTNRFRIQTPHEDLVHEGTNPGIVIMDGETLTVTPICTKNGQDIYGEGMSVDYRDFDCVVDVGTINFAKSGSDVQISWSYNPTAPYKVEVSSPGKTEILDGNITSVKRPLNDGDTVTITPICVIDNTYSYAAGKAVVYEMPVCEAAVNDIRFEVTGSGSVVIYWQATGNPTKYIVESSYKTETVNNSPVQHFINPGSSVKITPICVLEGYEVTGNSKTAVFGGCSKTIGEISGVADGDGLTLNWTTPAGAASKYRVSWSAMEVFVTNPTATISAASAGVTNYLITPICTIGGVDFVGIGKVYTYTKPGFVPVTIAAGLPLPNGKAGVNYSHIITVNGTAPYDVVIDEKPEWMTIIMPNGDNKAYLMGTPPTVQGNQLVKFRIRNNSSSYTIEQRIDVTTDGTACIAVTKESTSIPAASVGAVWEYNVTLNGTPPFGIIVNSKPDWMTVIINGNILKYYGTPTMAGSNNVYATLYNCGRFDSGQGVNAGLSFNVAGETLTCSSSISKPVCFPNSATNKADVSWNVLTGSPIKFRAFVSGKVDTTTTNTNISLSGLSLYDTIAITPICLVEGVEVYGDTQYTSYTPTPSCYGRVSAPTVNYNAGTDRFDISWSVIEGAPVKFKVSTSWRSDIFTTTATSISIDAWRLPQGERLEIVPVCLTNGVESDGETRFYYRN